MGGGLEAAVAADVLPGDGADAGGRPAKLLVGADQLGADRVLADDDVVAVDHHKGVVSRERLRHAHGVAQAQGLLLADEVDVGQVGDAKALFQHFFLAGGSQLFFQLGAAVEVVLNDRLVPAQDDEDVGDAGADRLFDQVLDGGLIHDGQHPLGHGLGGGQDPRAQAGGRDDGFFDGLHKRPPSDVTLIVRSPAPRWRPHWGPGTG